MGSHGVLGTNTAGFSSGVNGRCVLCSQNVPVVWIHTLNAGVCVPVHVVVPAWVVAKRLKCNLAEALYKEKYRVDFGDDECCRLVREIASAMNYLHTSESVWTWCACGAFDSGGACHLGHLCLWCLPKAPLPFAACST